MAIKHTTGLKKSTKPSTSKKSQKGKKSGDGIISASVQVDSDNSVGVRKIQNGFIVCESGMKGKGRNKDYYSKEYYSPSNPLKIQSPLKFGKK